MAAVCAASTGRFQMLDTWWIDRLGMGYKVKINRVVARQLVTGQPRPTNALPENTVRSKKKKKSLGSREAGSILPGMAVAIAIHSREP
jgi:hypothetical protein